MDSEVDETMFQRRKDEKKMYAGKKRTSDDNVTISPSQILRKCDGIPFESIKPVLMLCSSSQKLEFIKLNERFAEDVEGIFKELIMEEFEWIKRRPSRYQYWYEFYEALIDAKKDDVAMRLEKVTLRIAKNQKRAENVRKTKVIETVHGGSSKKPVLTATKVPIPRQAIGVKKPARAVHQVATSTPTKPAPLFKKSLKMYASWKKQF